MDNEIQKPKPHKEESIEYLAKKKFSEILAKRAKRESSAKKKVENVAKSKLRQLREKKEKIKSKEKLEGEDSVKESSKNIFKGVDSKSYKVELIKKKCEYLHGMKMPFSLSKSGNTYELISNLWKEKAIRKAFKPSDLTFIKSVKDYALKNCVGVNFMETDFKNSNIEYIKVNKFQVGDVVLDMIYIDINNAYWDTARNLGIISNEIYKRGMFVSKIPRLSALGALAKTTDTWKYNGEVFVKEQPVRSWSTENLWFAICKKVSDTMVEIAEAIGDDFVFYWVDGIYIKNNPKSFQKVLEIFLKNGYTSKFQQVPKVEFFENQFVVQGVQESDKKRYSWSVAKDKSNKPISDYIENQRLLQVAQDLMHKNSLLDKRKAKSSKDRIKEMERKENAVILDTKAKKEAIRNLISMSMGKE